MATKKALPSAEWLRQELRYEPDTGLLFWKIKRNGRDMSRSLGWRDPKGYLRITFYKRGTFGAHLLAWVIFHGEEPPSETTVDHRNGNKADNRICNLRVATSAEQSANRGTRANKHGHRGVSFHKTSGLWMARIGVERERIFLGMYQTAEEAADAYAKAAKKLHGEFARVA